eukprot:Platyproteum_vivax@DN7591_c3_g4_i1.p1
MPRPRMQKSYETRARLNNHLTANPTHQREGIKPPLKPFPCKYKDCGKSYVEHRDLRIHWDLFDKHRPQDPAAVIRRLTDAKQPKPKESREDRTMARPSGSETTCSSCGQTFPTSRQLNQHITRIHLVEPMLKRRQKEFVNCNICDKMCTGNRNLKDHLKREHHVSPIKKMKPATQPDDPPQPDSPDQDGEIPLLTTTPRKRFKCPVGGCDKDYKLKQHATRHIIDNHLDQTNGIKDFKCPICSKKFLKKTRLQSPHESETSRTTNRDPQSCFYCTRS